MLNLAKFGYVGQEGGPIWGDPYFGGIFLAVPLGKMPPKMPIFVKLMKIQFLSLNKILKESN